MSDIRLILTADKTKRLIKLEAIANKLRHGENVQNRQLQAWLSAEEYEQFEYEWQEQLELREELKDKHSTAKKFYNKSESLCEDAIEILREILHYDSSLRVWLDRDISSAVGGDLSADIVSLPRLVTSRSHEKLSNNGRLTSKQSVKLTVVERAMHSIGRDATPVPKDDVSKLDEFLNTND